MIPFKTTPEQVRSIVPIVFAMEAAGLDSLFIKKVSELAKTDQGVYDLMALWLDETESPKREAIVADLQKSLDEYSNKPDVIFL